MTSPSPFSAALSMSYAEKTVSDNFGINKDVSRSRRSRQNVDRQQIIVGSSTPFLPSPTSPQKYAVTHPFAKRNSGSGVLSSMTTKYKTVEAALNPYATTAHAAFFSETVKTNQAPQVTLFRYQTEPFVEHYMSSSVNNSSCSNSSRPRSVYSSMPSFEGEHIDQAADLYSSPIWNREKIIANSNKFTICTSAPGRKNRRGWNGTDTSRISNAQTAINNVKLHKEKQSALEKAGRRCLYDGCSNLEVNTLGCCRFHHDMLNNVQFSKLPTKTIRPTSTKTETNEYGVPLFRIPNPSNASPFTINNTRDYVGNGSLFERSEEKSRSLNDRLFLELQRQRGGSGLPMSFNTVREAESMRTWKNISPNLHNQLRPIESIQHYIPEVYDSLHQHAFGSIASEEQSGFSPRVSIQRDEASKKGVIRGKPMTVTFEEDYALSLAQHTSPVSSILTVRPKPAGTSSVPLHPLLDPSTVPTCPFIPVEATKVSSLNVDKNTFVTVPGTISGPKGIQEHLVSRQKLLTRTAIGLERVPPRIIRISPATLQALVASPTSGQLSRSDMQAASFVATTDTIPSTARDIYAEKKEVNFTPLNARYTPEPDFEAVDFMRQAVEKMAEALNVNQDRPRRKLDENLINLITRRLANRHPRLVLQQRLIIVNAGYSPTDFGQAAVLKGVFRRQRFFQPSFDWMLPLLAVYMPNEADVEQAKIEKDAKVYLLTEWLRFRKLLEYYMETTNYFISGEEMRLMRLKKQEEERKRQKMEMMVMLNTKLSNRVDFRFLKSQGIVPKWLDVDVVPPSDVDPLFLLKKQKIERRARQEDAVAHNKEAADRENVKARKYRIRMGDEEGNVDAVVAETDDVFHNNNQKSSYAEKYRNEEFEVPELMSPDERIACVDNFVMSTDGIVEFLPTSQSGNAEKADAHRKLDRRGAIEPSSSNIDFQSGYNRQREHKQRDLGPSSTKSSAEEGGENIPAGGTKKEDYMKRVLVRRWFGPKHRPKGISHKLALQKSTLMWKMNRMTIERQLALRPTLSDMQYMAMVLGEHYALLASQGKLTAEDGGDYNPHKRSQVSATAAENDEGKVDKPKVDKGTELNMYNEIRLTGKGEIHFVPVTGAIAPIAGAVISPGLATVSSDPVAALTLDQVMCAHYRRQARLVRPVVHHHLTMKAAVLPTQLLMRKSLLNYSVLQLATASSEGPDSLRRSILSSPHMRALQEQIVDKQLSASKPAKEQEQQLAETDTVDGVEVHTAVYIFGRGDRGELGCGENVKMTNVPTVVPFKRPVRCFAQGENHTVLMTTDGQCFSFGDNKYGQLGLLDKLRRSRPFLIQYGESPLLNCRMRTVFAGFQWSAFVTTDDEVWVAGSGQHGVLGLGKVQTKTGARKAAATTRWVGGDSDEDRSDTDEDSGGRAGDTGGRRMMVGDDLTDMSGDGTGAGDSDDDVSVPTRIDFFTGKKVFKIAYGKTHAAAVTAGGALYTWGSTNRGQTGQGRPKHLPEKFSSPQRISTEHSFMWDCWVDVCCGVDITTVLTNNMKVYVCGANSTGGLGIGHLNDEYNLTMVQSLFHVNIVKIACGHNHIAVLDELGTLYCSRFNRLKVVSKATLKKREEKRARRAARFGVEDLRREDFDEGGDAPVDVAEGNLLPTGHSQGMSKGSGGQRVVEVGTAWFGPSVEHGLDDSDLEVDAPAAGQEGFGSGSDGDASDPEDSEASTSENSDEDKGDNEKNDNDAGKGKSDGTGTANDADYMAVIQRAQLRAQGGRLHRNAAVVNIGRGVLAGRGKFGMVEQLRSDGCRFVRLQPWLHLKEISCGPTTVSALTYSGHMFTWKCGSSDAVSPARNLINSLFTYPPCPGEKAGDLDYEIIVTPSGPQLTRKGWAHVASGMRAASQFKKGLPLIHRDQRHDLMSLAVGKMTKTFLVQAPKPFFVFGEGAS